MVNPSWLCVAYQNWERPKEKDYPLLETHQGKDEAELIKPEFQKTSCYSYVLENFLTFTKIYNKFGEYFNFLAFSKLFPCIFLYFLNRLYFSRAFQKNQTN